MNTTSTGSPRPTPASLAVRTVAALAVAGGLAAAATGSVSADHAGGAVHASAVIVDVGGEEIGFARLVEDGTGAVHVNLKVAGLSEGKHGVHIHENGSCASVSGGPFSGAGAHYDPYGVPHADHAGDLPNLVSNVAGRGHLEATTTRVTLSDGTTSVFDLTTGHVGSAIVIHANEDDFGPVANGNSGGRIACGVIVAG